MPETQEPQVAADRIITWRRTHGNRHEVRIGAEELASPLANALCYGANAHRQFGLEAQAAQGADYERWIAIQIAQAYGRMAIRSIFSPWLF